MLLCALPTGAVRQASKARAATKVPAMRTRMRSVRDLVALPEHGSMLKRRHLKSSLISQAVSTSLKPSIPPPPPLSIVALTGSR